MLSRTLACVLVLTGLAWAGPGMAFLRPQNQALLELAQQNTQASREQFDQRIWSTFDVRAVSGTILGALADGLSDERREEFDGLVARLLGAELWLTLQGVREIVYVSEASEGDVATVGTQMGPNEVRFVVQRTGNAWQARELSNEDGQVVRGYQLQVAQTSTIRAASQRLQKRLDQLVSAAGPQR